LFFKELWGSLRGQWQRFVVPIATCKIFEPVFAR
jgi:hypothetical protein